MKRILLTLCLSFAAVSGAMAEGLLAFPGAEGFGRFARGARAGGVTPTVYHVTNLNDKGPGSLRDAVSQPNRVVVFDVSGVIKLESRLQFSKNLVVAGQTAPGSGVCVYGDGVTFTGASDIIVRYMRFRAGDGATGKTDAAGAANGKNMIFDHCSVSWGIDETFSVSSDGKNGGIGNITIQKSIISQGFAPHSAGGLCQPDNEVGGVTLYRVLYADNGTRNHKVKGINQYINNVVYNWGSGGGYNLGGDSEGSIWADVQANYFIQGPASGGNGIGSGNELTRVYQRGNKTDMSKDGVINGRDITGEQDFPRSTRFETLEELAADMTATDATFVPHPSIVSMSQTADEALAWIIDSVGACLPARDEVDAYVIDELLSYGTKGEIIATETSLRLVGGVGNFYNAPKPQDSDNDGMPDAWEIANGLNPNDASDAVVIAENGYLNIENYINSIPDSPIPFLKYPVEIEPRALGTDSVTLKFVCREENPEAKVRVRVIPASGSVLMIDDIAPDAGKITIKGLSEKTNYTAEFSTYTADMESEKSIYSFTTKGAPGEPELSSDPVPSDGANISDYITVQLSYTNTTPGLLTSYYLYLGTSPDQLDSITTTRAKKFVINVEQNTTYYWRIDAKNSYGRTSGPVWSFTTGQEPVRTKVAYFAFDEVSGSTAANTPDEEILLTNDAAAHGSYVPVWEAGKIGGALNFSGANASDAMVVDSYDDIVFESAPFSYELWFKSTSGNSSQSRYLLHKGSHAASGSNTGDWFGLEYKNGNFYFCVDDNVTKSTAQYASTSYFDGKWHHVVAVRDTENKKLRLYIDGAEKASGDDKTGAIEGTEALVIGNSNVTFDAPFVGTIDEVTIYSDALTAIEVKAKYESGLSAAIENVVSDEAVAVYPNPFNNYFSIALPQSEGAAEVSVYSLSGALVYAGMLPISGSVVEVNGLEELPAGVYTCVVVADKVARTVRVIKQ